MEKKFIVADNNSVCNFVYEKSAFSGVKKIVAKVCDDINLVTDKMPLCKEIESYEFDSTKEKNIFIATAGKSSVLDSLEREGKINLSSLNGKRECFGWFLVNSTLIIAGSDKRGTIYGLFRISDLMNVSPLVNWSLVLPAKKSSVEFTESDCIISKEPSVKYRGFFINDEWPAFGTWCMKHFGGVNANMYENVFELLLRMKGNYMWPAMWGSCFAQEGPGLLSAELADELGVVMGLSHHEPCLRHGNEYGQVRGKDSIYGDAWNFWANRDGITRFWEDGLKRNGHLENVITIGMRGEADSVIMKDATLKQNIDLLKDVISVQHKLIKENINSNLNEVPRMLALYKEVEPFFYGDKDTPGLIEWDELSDVILMLCDDNHGYLRTLPDEKMREHKGGYGMYYHFDYHGDPVSYEWTNSTELTEVWEQMTTAYEFGVRDLWIVNVGDLGLQEFPLTFFMNLAYDYDKWGMNETNNAKSVSSEYISEWVKLNFSQCLDKENQKLLCSTIKEFNHLNHNLRPEHLGDKSYHPVHFGEAKKVFDAAQTIKENCEKLKNLIGSDSKNYPSFVQLISYNAAATANLHQIWINNIWNHYFASQGLLVSNTYADETKRLLEKDIEYTKELHTVADGKWDGFGLAKHIGFTHWNCEQRMNPVLHYTIPNADPMLIAGLTEKELYTSGEDWSKKTLPLNLKNKKNENSFYVATRSNVPTNFEITWKNKNILINGSNSLSAKGTLSEKNLIEYFTVSSGGKNAESLSGEEIIVNWEAGHAKIKVVFEDKEYSVLNAEHYSTKNETPEGKLLRIESLGRDSDGIKFIPVTKDFTENVKEENLPYVEYEIESSFEGNGIIQFVMLPTNAFRNGKNNFVTYSVNGSAIVREAILEENYVVGHSLQWAKGVMTHSRIHTSNVSVKKGKNKIRFYATSSGIVLEKIILAKDENSIPGSFFGPQEAR